MVLPNGVSELSDQAILYDIRGRELAAFKLVQETERVVKITIPSSMYLANQLMIFSVRSEGKIYTGKFVFLKR